MAAIPDIIGQTIGRAIGSAIQRASTRPRAERTADNARDATDPVIQQPGAQAAGDPAQTTAEDLKYRAETREYSRAMGRLSGSLQWSGGENFSPSREAHAYKGAKLVEFLEFGPANGDEHSPIMAYDSSTDTMTITAEKEHSFGWEVAEFLGFHKGGFFYNVFHGLNSDGTPNANYIARAQAESAATESIYRFGQKVDRAMSAPLSPTYSAVQPPMSIFDYPVTNPPSYRWAVNGKGVAAAGLEVVGLRGAGRAGSSLGAAESEVAQITLNAAKGRAFEEAGIRGILSHVGLGKNTTAVTRNGVTTILDAWGRPAGLVEFKDVVNLSSSPQLRAQLAEALATRQPYNLVVSPGNQSISKSLLRQIERVNQQVGGGVYRYDPATDILTPFGK